MVVPLRQWTHCCSVWYVVVRCSMAVCCRDLLWRTPVTPHTATHCNTLQYTAMDCTTLQHTATDATFCGANSLQQIATDCNRLQQTAAHCNTQDLTDSINEVGLSGFCLIKDSHFTRETGKGTVKFQQICTGLIAWWDQSLGENSRRTEWWAKYSEDTMTIFSYKRACVVQNTQQLTSLSTFCEVATGAFK